MKTIIEMAREAGLRSAVLLHVYGKESALCDSELEELEQIKWFAALVRADEREACAKVCDDIATEDGWEGSYANGCAVAIRARGQA